MKIRMNYDLIEKIRESKTGVSLKRIVNKTTLYTSIYSLLSVPKIYISVAPLEELLKTVIKCGLVYSSIIGLTSLLCSSLAKNAAISELKKLSL